MPIARYTCILSALHTLTATVHTTVATNPHTKVSGAYCSCALIIYCAERAAVSFCRSQLYSSLLTWRKMNFTDRPER